MTVSTRNTFFAGASIISAAILSGLAYAGGGSGGGHGPVVPGAHMGGSGGSDGGHCCKGPKGPRVHVPGVHVSGPNVSIHGSNVSVHQGSMITNTQSFLSTSVVSGGDSSVVFGGGGGYYQAQGVAPTAIGALNVEGAEESYFETITEQIPSQEEYCEEKISVQTIIRPVQAVCIDDKGIPHPASRVDASEHVPAGYKGELFRCMAGTAMQVTLGRVENGSASFSHGETFACRKGEALVHKHGGNLACAPQSPERDCNERSLLRRHGPGIKLVTAQEQIKACIPQTRTIMKSVERQVERKRETKAQAMVFDGGVGQGVN